MSLIPASRIGAMAWDPPNLAVVPTARQQFCGADSLVAAADAPGIAAADFGRRPFVMVITATAHPRAPARRLPQLAGDAWRTPQPPGWGSGFLSSLATLGTSSAAPPAPSLAGSFTGTGGPATPPMPSTLQAFYQGLGAATRQLGQTTTLGTSPQPSGWGSGFLSSLATLGASPQPPGWGSGFLSSLATLGTSSSAPPAPSLAGSFPGTGSPATPPMPSTLQAFYQGLGAATRQLGQTLAPGAPSLAAQNSPAAEPLGWSDLANPSRIAPKVAYQFAQSSPTLAGGVALGVIGGELGALAGPVGAATEPSSAARSAPPP